MKTDIYGQQIFTENEVCELYLSNPDIKIQSILVDTDITVDAELELNDIPSIRKYIDPKVSIQEFDTNNQNNWFIPDSYKSIDIAQFVLDQCKSEAELQRAGSELLLFQERNLFPLLRYLKYLVDVMRENNIVWGVGRGSSVASFVLFLLGVHRINSLYYDLSIEEFLK
jgi:DNA polymerase III alpha subunit